MKNLLKYLWLLAAVMGLLCSVSCSKDDDKGDEDTKLSMSGDIEYDLPSFILVNELRKLSASGITEPADVKYRWIISALYKDSLFGESVIVRFPDSLGSYTVNCYAVADGYYKVVKSIETTTVDTSSVNGSLQGFSQSDTYIVDTRDNRKYRTVKIGNLEWFAENLAWKEAGVPYKKAEIMSYIFGNFYTWEEATGGQSGSGLGGGPQGVCPPGWSVPTNEDWEDLAMAANDGKVLKFNDMWAGVGEKASVNVTFNGDNMWEYWPDNVHTNTVGWNAIPCGYTIRKHSLFEGIMEYGLWWSSSERDADKAYYRYIYKKQSEFPANYGAKNDYGMSVRCVRVISE